MRQTIFVMSWICVVTAWTGESSAQTCEEIWDVNALRAGLSSRGEDLCEIDLTDTRCKAYLIGDCKMDPARTELEQEMLIYCSSWIPFRTYRETLKVVGLIPQDIRRILRPDCSDRWLGPAMSHAGVYYDPYVISFVATKNVQQGARRRIELTEISLRSGNDTLTFQFEKP